MIPKKPTVSQLIDLLNKPALIKWANKIGLQGVSLDDYNKKSTSNGSSIHLQIEKFLDYNVPFRDLQTQNNFVEFIKDKEIITIEKDIYHDLFFGRLDIKFKFNGNIYICDFKPKNNYSTIFFEQKLQLAMYKYADECDKVGIISYPDFTLQEVEFDFEVYKRIIDCLCNLYNLKLLV
ncbi:hypothetical protein UFOVP129_58 [uncultured Caudovirales phage]|uniref:PD-(D/E)XK nuclease superfamily n=1 Tax=uncultured Caudovirales phage TaxID=2100421 RepID=A0A6J5LE83_9CAUD|nr:hypothetical protein UFOVP129_58 [uncultured Caudovirales phage]